MCSAPKVNIPPPPPPPPAPPAQLEQLAPKSAKGSDGKGRKRDGLSRYQIGSGLDAASSSSSNSLGGLSKKTGV